MEGLRVCLKDKDFHWWINKKNNKIMEAQKFNFPKLSRVFNLDIAY